MAHPLPEVLLLLVLVCGTIAAGDDYDEIVDWGNAHLPFLRRFLPFDWGMRASAGWHVMVNERLMRPPVWAISVVAQQREPAATAGHNM